MRNKKTPWDRTQLTNRERMAVAGMLPKPKVITEAEVLAALQVIVDNAENKALNYAVTYAEAGIHHPWYPDGRAMTGDTLVTQVLYVLNNTASWRGEEARRVKETLRAYVKEAKNG